MNHTNIVLKIIKFLYEILKKPKIPNINFNINIWYFRFFISP
jgi:hypothetical protein